MRYIDISPQANGLAKNKGHSAVAKHAYITRSGRYAKQHDPVLAFGSLGMPDFAASRAGAYWSSVDKFERKNATLAMEYVFPLPAVLDKTNLVKIACEWAGAMSRFHAPAELPVTWALHAGNGTNPHVHLMISERKMDERSRLLPRDKIFKRYDRKAPERGGAEKGQKLFLNLEYIKSLYVDFLNRIMLRAGIAIEFVFGSLANLRKMALRKANDALRRNDEVAAMDTYWWFIKTNRPVTTHMGRASAKGQTEAAKRRRKKVEAECLARDLFLEEAGWLLEGYCREADLPIPTEAAEYAIAWRQRPNFKEYDSTKNSKTISQNVELMPRVDLKSTMANSSHPETNSQNEPGMRTAGTEDHKRPSFHPAVGKENQIKEKSAPTGRFTIDKGLAHLDRGRPTVFKSNLWKKIYGVEASDTLAASIKYVNTDSLTFLTWSNALIRDFGNEIRTNKIDDQSIILLVEQALTKGWTHVELRGGTPTLQAALKESGIQVVAITTNHMPDRAKPESAIDAAETRELGAAGSPVSSSQKIAESNFDRRLDSETHGVLEIPQEASDQEPEYGQSFKPR
ncbi:MobA/MobL family protein [Ferrovibrio sp.]|uniref:MobA/MobL family protein n=1 Tax=Ferrovibrio sp. TaxID=1917215 RepID=UPI0025C49762|nr:MobA/MobL family protein [Ferrovibrio sp.]MBX3454151.1 MobA/MobL family protein [Ferrovibrio sp.]